MTSIKRLNLSIGIIKEIRLIDMGHNDHDLTELSEADYQEFLKWVNSLVTDYADTGCFKLTGG